MFADFDLGNFTEDNTVSQGLAYVRANLAAVLTHLLLAYAS